MAKKKKVTRYRDRKTGRFVSKKSWQRSRARGGTRFVRTRFEREKRTKRKVARPQPLPEPERREREEEEIEFAGAFDSP